MKWNEIFYLEGSVAMPSFGGGRTNNESVLKMNQNLLELFEKAKILLDDQKNKLISVEKDQHIQIMPPSCHFSVAVWGPSGVGKSWTIGKFLEAFRKKYKDRPIYIFLVLLKTTKHL